MATLQANVTGACDIIYPFPYDNADIGPPQSAGTNIVSTMPATINLGKWQVNCPLTEL